LRYSNSIQIHYFSDIYKRNNNNFSYIDVGHNYRILSMFILSFFKRILKNQYISSIIIGSFFFALPTLISLIKSLIYKKSFSDSFNSFWTIKIELWIILLSLFLFAMSYTFIKSIRKRKVKFKYDNDSLKVDRNLFQKIHLNLLPQSGTIQWLRMHNFGESFKDELLDPLLIIGNENFKSDFEFLNPKLEELKTSLIDDIENFNSVITSQTFRHGPHSQSVPKEWVYEQPERYDRVVNELNNLANSICKRYDNLIRLARKTLKI
jgi:hypothetical protein